MVKKGAFGEVVGVEGTDYFVTETLDNGNRVCVTSKVRVGEPDATKCCAEIRGARGGFNMYGSKCSKNATEQTYVERHASTSTGRYGHTIQTFTIDANGFVIGGFETVMEKVLVGYCGTHDPNRVAAREEKKRKEQNEEYQLRLKREESDRNYKLNTEAKVINYAFIEKAARNVIVELLGKPGMTEMLSGAQKEAIAALAKQLDMIPAMVAAGKKNYGVSSYMMTETGDLKDNYKVAVVTDVQ